MNWKLGLFRLWFLATALWVLGVGYFAFLAFDKPTPFRGDYQYSEQLKDVPWNTDWSKPLYEIIDPPGKGRFPDEFSPVEEKYIEQWDADVKAGKMVIIEFPDFSSLYLSAQLTKEDQTYILAAALVPLLVKNLAVARGSVPPSCCSACAWALPRMGEPWLCKKARC